MFALGICCLDDLGYGGDVWTKWKLSFVVFVVGGKPKMALKQTLNIGKPQMLNQCVGSWGVSEKDSTSKELHNSL